MKYSEVVKESMSISDEYDILTESSGLSRIWQYTHQDNHDFAIIGTKDKDTKDDRTEEFLEYLKEKMSRNNMITYKKMRGNYTHDDGSFASENSFLINNISFADAMDLMHKINQESIIWKDNDYFGFIDDNGNPDGSLSTDEKNMGFNSDDVNAFGSHLKSKHNKGQGFTFKLEQFVPKYSSRSSVRNMGGDNKYIVEELFSIKIN